MFTSIGFSDLKNDVSTMIRGRLSRPVVPEAPYLDDEALAFFLDALRTADVYLEYGSGGSTRVAATHVNEIVSVETDAVYARAVREEVRHANPETRLRLVHADIGLTASWGIPFVKIPTQRRARRWVAYPDAPWVTGLLPAHGPDLILVDGRFRVASCARSLMALPERSECLILVDDYAVRPEYWVLESVAEKVQSVGRMGVFRRGGVGKDVLSQVRHAFALDWR